MSEYEYLCAKIDFQFLLHLWQIMSDIFASLRIYICVRSVEIVVFFSMIILHNMQQTTIHQTNNLNKYFDFTIKNIIFMIKFVER